MSSEEAQRWDPQGLQRMWEDGLPRLRCFGSHTMATMFTWSSQPEGFPIFLPMFSFLCEPWCLFLHAPFSCYEKVIQSMC